MSTTRGKTTPASTGGSFRPHAGEKSRVTPDAPTGDAAGSRHHAVAGPVRSGAREWGYTIRDFHDPDRYRPLGLSLHTGYALAHRTHGHKYGITAPGHHWSGIAANVAAFDKLADVHAIVSRTYAHSDTMQFDGEPAWASMLMDTVNQTAVVRLRTDRSGHMNDWRIGTEVRLARNTEGDWEVTDTNSGYISHGEGQLRTINDDPFHNHRVTETVEWFHRNLNYWESAAR